jgi:2-succinyl-5-enolpyruvyl-6-hydroxy-3-cyclohexene-1-carboxylate synthase
LVRNEVGLVVAAPGSRSAALVMAVAERTELSLVVAVDERSAAFWALGMAKASGRPSVVITTSGTAAANCLPAVVEADASATALLVLTADRPPELRHAMANQTIDQIKLFGERVRWFCEMGAPEAAAGSVAYWRSTVCRAVAEAGGLSGRPGPVHLNLAFREPLVPLSDDGRTRAEPFPHPLEGRADGRPWTRARRGSPSGQRLTLSGKGIIVVGEGTDNLAAVHRLAARLRWPMIAEAHSSARYGAAVSTAHFILDVPEVAEVLRPEVIVKVGRAGLSRNVSRLLASGPPQIAVDELGRWTDPERSVADLLVGSVDRLAVGEPAPPEWRESWMRLDRAARRTLDAQLDSFELPTEPRIARDTARAVPVGGTLSVGSSMPVRDLDWFMAPRRIRVISNRGASGIDGFVSTSMGAATAHGGVVALTGDLALLHDQNGFIADRLPPAVFVVVNNDGGGIFSFLPQAGFPDSFERLFATPHRRDLADLARLHRLGYRSIEQAGELSSAISQARSQGGVHLLEARTDRAANVAVHRQIEEVVRSAIAVELNSPTRSTL